MKMAQAGGKLSELEEKDKLVARIDKYQKWAEKMEFDPLSIVQDQARRK